MKTLNIEWQIIKRAVQDLLKAGYQVSVDDGGDSYENGRTEPSTDVEKIMDALFSVDEEYLIVTHPHNKSSWIFLVHGNGIDVISDYGTSLDAVLKGALDLAERLDAR